MNADIIVALDKDEIIAAKRSAIRITTIITAITTAIIAAIITATIEVTNDTPEKDVNHIIKAINVIRAKIEPISIPVVG